jgi:hypothetical protein
VASSGSHLRLSSAFSEPEPSSAVPQGHVGSPWHPFWGRRWVPVDIGCACQVTGERGSVGSGRSVSRCWDLGWWDQPFHAALQPRRPSASERSCCLATTETDYRPSSVPHASLSMHAWIDVITGPELQGCGVVGFRARSACSLCTSACSNLYNSTSQHFDSVHALT